VINPHGTVDEAGLVAFRYRMPDDVLGHMAVDLIRERITSQHIYAVETALFTLDAIVNIPNNRQGL